MARIDIYDLEYWRRVALESRYCVRSVCTKAGVSQRQLQRYTRLIFGRSPQQWLNEERLMSAGNRLKESRSVKAVAWDLGFKQVSHFSREFRCYYGLSPSAFLAWMDREKRMSSVESPFGITNVHRR